jgi:GNAT superfamily N-acetyltransferase
MRSKASWGYDQTFMAACTAELTIPPGRCGPRLVVALRGAALVGYAELDGDPPAVELRGLFVEPEAQGRGIGRILFDDAVQRARALGATTLFWDADPFAEEIYRRLGGRTVGREPSGSVPGRTLPRMQLELVGDGA